MTIIRTQTTRARPSGGVDLLAAQAAHGDSDDFVRALQSYWARLGRDYDAALLVECGYVWWVERDCWQAPHKPRETELAALKRLEPYFRGSWQMKP